MSDDKKNPGPADRGKVAGGEGYEVDYFAKKHGMTRAEARRFILEIGNDREKLGAAAEKAKSRNR